MESQRSPDTYGTVLWTRIFSESAEEGASLDTTGQWSEVPGLALRSFDSDFGNAAPHRELALDIEVSAFISKFGSVKDPDAKIVFALFFHDEIGAQWPVTPDGGSSQPVHGHYTKRLTERTSEKLLPIALKSCIKSTTNVRISAKRQLVVKLQFIAVTERPERTGP